MSRPASLAGDPRVRWTFLVNTYSTGWFWYPKGVGFLYCVDGLLQFEPAGSIPFRSPTPFQHTDRRVLLLSPFAIPNHFTVVVFAGGAVSISIARNRAQIRTTLAECGFGIVDAPRQRWYPLNQRKAWERHMRLRVLSERIPRRTVLGGVDKPMAMHVRCQACGDQVKLEYHDIQIRWHAATASPQTHPDWMPFDAARPTAGDETALDMSCTSCATPMRVIVRASEWRMSVWAYHVIEVLVLAPDSAGS